MRQALTNDPFHNPFNNRFNDPVTRRHDEMQADAYMTWLRERSQGCDQTQSEHNPSLLSIIAEGAASVSKEVESRHGGRIFAGVLALVLVLVISVAALLKAV